MRATRINELAQVLFGRRFTELERSPQCDVLSFYCHRRHNAEVFVTSDGNFLRKRGRLSGLTASAIVDPEAALALALEHTR
ncbi:hypothetical protein [Candidatus Aeolococcus gillhamiae]|uniref:hypothetical protein n=1 Tax=Candidatus Aeolococcus gillhamiae TaxID=3127015 RepID=UPI0030777815